MKLLTNILPISSMLVIYATSASAALTSGPFSTTTPISSTLTDWSNTLAFPKFDPSLGTLISADFTFNSGLSTVLTVTNTGPVTTTGNARTEVIITVDGVEVMDYFSPKQNFSVPVSSSQTLASATATGSGTLTYNTPGVLSPFIGVGSFTLPASTDTATTVTTTAGNSTAAQVTSATLSGTVIYTYEAIPEPTAVLSTAMLLSGGLLLRRRSRFSR